jgi:pyruvate dehydrogenase E2 component (dihydrolipoamide acetyltransferase)
MATEILMPALSPTMEEGTLAKWLVKEGDTVQSGDLLAEIETDKATMEFEAVDEGVIGKLLVAEGTEGVSVNTPIAVLLEDGESADDAAAKSAPKAEDAKPEQPKAVEPLTEKPKATSGPAPTDASADVKGSGPHGRIVKSDVEGLTAAPKAQATAAPAIAKSADSDTVKAMYADREFEEVSLNGMRKTIAQRLTEAKQSIPHFYLRRDIKIDRLLSLRSELNAGLEKSGVKLSVNDFVIKACAKALQDVPNSNAVWAGDRILKLKPSDVAVAVAVEDGLFTPVIRDSDRKTLSEISSEMKELAGKARDKKLAPHEYQGGSFAISNLGMFGVDNFDAVINPPHGSILAVGAGKKRPVVADDGGTAAATVMSVTLSVDHRVIDGALGAEFLNAIVGYLENPLTILA